MGVLCCVGVGGGWGLGGQYGGVGVGGTCCGVVLSVALLGTQHEKSGLSSKHFSYVRPEGVLPWKSPSSEEWKSI